MVIEKIVDTIIDDLAMTSTGDLTDEIQQQVNR